MGWELSQSSGSTKVSQCDRQHRPADQTMSDLIQKQLAQASTKIRPKSFTVPCLKPYLYTMESTHRIQPVYFFHPQELLTENPNLRTISFLGSRSVVSSPTERYGPILSLYLTTHVPKRPLCSGSFPLEPMTVNYRSLFLCVSVLQEPAIFLPHTLVIMDLFVTFMEQRQAKQGRAKKNEKPSHPKMFSETEHACALLRLKPSVMRYGPERLRGDLDLPACQRREN
ncbi:hypothetical protein RRG08_050562 [Elysia crispata]|uniref:Uncharacterized protein n=1 Tax=Elysia crispata TaxID=231223 RepID=A0AAE0Z6W0_9GAST|nr:hypothetical protein RRG08_050562 [Elysia crispata]